MYIMLRACWLPTARVSLTLCEEPSLLQEGVLLGSVLAHPPQIRQTSVYRFTF